MTLEVYDFRGSNRMPEAHIRVLRSQQESLARDFVSTLSAFLRTYVAVKLADIRQMSFGEFRQGLPSPTCAAKLAVMPGGGGAVLEINYALAFPILEILMGGTGQASSGVERGPTEIEKRLLNEFLDLILRDLNRFWRPTAGVEYQVQGIETDPQLIRVLTPGDTVLVVTFEVGFGEVQGSLNLAVPFNILTDIHSAERERVATEAAGYDRHAVLDALRLVPLALEAQLRGARMKLREVMAVKPGEILEFDYSLDDPVDLTVNQLPKMSGRIVASDDKRGFVVERLSRHD